MNVKSEIFSTHKNKYFVAHLDILGFKEIIKSCNADNIDSIGNVINDSIGDAIRIFKGNSFLVKTFSDNICIAVKADHSQDLENLLSLVSIIQRKLFIEHEMPLRGAIAWGLHYQKNNTIFSPTYVKAYELETKMAIFPRIILDGELVLNYRDMHCRGMYKLAPSLGKITLKDNIDSLYFIDYMYASLLAMILHSLQYQRNDITLDVLNVSIQYYNKHIEIINKKLKEIKKHGVLLKYHWLRYYHNHTIMRLRNDFINDVQELCDLNKNVRNLIESILESIVLVPNNGSAGFEFENAAHASW